ncbi:MAG: hypothetical protein HGA66_00280 [Holophaga sp.]|nr:hypothetical protein [Holophaga sp.]
MSNPFTFRKESLQPASAASANMGGRSPLKQDTKGGRPAVSHGDPSITITTSLTHTWPG